MVSLEAPKKKRKITKKKKNGRRKRENIKEKKIEVFDVIPIVEQEKRNYKYSIRSLTIFLRSNSTFTKKCSN